MWHISDRSSQIRLFAVPQSATQTASIYAQNLVPISSCLSNALNKDAKKKTVQLLSQWNALLIFASTIPSILSTLADIHEANVKCPICYHLTSSLQMFFTHANHLLIQSGVLPSSCGDTETSPEDLHSGSNKTGACFVALSVSGSISIWIIPPFISHICSFVCQD